MSEEEKRNTKEIETEQKITNNSFENTEDCIYAIIFIIITYIAVSWAWKIHWLLGIIVLLCLLGVL